MRKIQLSDRVQAVQRDSTDWDIFVNGSAVGIAIHESKWGKWSISGPVNFWKSKPKRPKKGGRLAFGRGASIQKAFENLKKRNEL